MLKVGKLVDFTLLSKVSIKNMLSTTYITLCRYHSLENLPSLPANVTVESTLVSCPAGIEIGSSL